MIRNVSYNNKEIKQEITDAVGKPFRLVEKFRNKLYGSQRFLIFDCSETISKLLQLDTNLNHCNIELRAGGIIVRFRSILNTYGWVIPYYKLNLFKNEGHYAIYADGDYIRIKAAHNASLDHSFFRKVTELKSQFVQQYTPIT